MMPFNQYASYLVRDSETTPGDYSLSVRDTDSVYHYKIQKFENGLFCITHRVQFETISELIQYYQIQADGLCVELRYPCLSVEKPQTVGLSKQANEEWEIDCRQIRLIRRLGAGQFGEVWEGLWNSTTTVAVKTLKTSILSPQEFLREAALMKKLQHPNLIQLYAVCTKEEPIYVIIEFMKYGSLLEYLRIERHSLQQPQLIDMSVQIATGMAYLESQNYIHRDLAACNVLVSEHMMCKVADFGLFSGIDENIFNEQIIISKKLKCAAPEVFLYNKFTIKSDIWSFGIVLYEIITYGRTPYPGLACNQLIKVAQGEYCMDCPANCPKELHDIMLECWSHEPAKRPTFKSLQKCLEEFYTTNEEYSIPI